MNEQQPTSPRRRLQELLAIPERQRTDAQWDELNEIEISLASANRLDAQGQGARGNAAPQPKHPRPSAGEQVRKPARKFGRRPPKTPPASGNNG